MQGKKTRGQEMAFSGLAFEELSLGGKALMRIFREWDVL